MDETPRTESTPHATRPGSTTTGGWLGWALGALAIGFFVAFIWQFYQATTARGQLSAVEQELVIERLKVRLGQAALAAQSGDYETARRQTSAFYTRLQENTPALTPDVRRVADDLLAMRDDVITGLSRGNPEYAGVLYGMLETFTNAVDPSAGTPQDGGMPTGGSPPAADTPGDGTG